MRLKLTKNLDAMRAAACERVDAEAEAVRQEFITIGAGQAMVYERKMMEARAYLGARSIDHREIPHLVHEAQADGMTILEKAEQIDRIASAWQITSAKIEGVRLGQKRAIANATTEAEIESLRSVDWSSVYE